MARNGKYGRALGKTSLQSYPIAGAPSSGSTYSYDPFGPGMAEDVFGSNDYYDDYSEEVCEPYSVVGELDPEDLYDGVTQSFHFRHQVSLDLETNEEREARLRSSIRRFERAYRCMSVYALKWHYLEEECEENPQLAKMFRDIQMMRKLGGSDRV